MKYHYRFYARALAEAAANAKTEAEKKAIVERFMKIVKEAGAERSLPKIIDLAETLLAKQTGHRKVILETARPLTSDAHGALKDHFERGDVVAESTNPTLVAGVRITVNGERQLDLSLNHRLNKLFSP